MLVPEPDATAAPRPYRERVSLADALDRILHRGVSVQGDLTIGLADVELLYLDLRLLLGSVDVIWPNGFPPIVVRPQAPSASRWDEPVIASPAAAARDPTGCELESGSPIFVESRPSESGSSSARGLVRLVLTLVKLLHEVLERQAVRRMDAGRLTEAQIEDLGAALFAQAEEIARLQRQFGLSDRDVSLDLGLPERTL